MKLSATISLLSLWIPALFLPGSAIGSSTVRGRRLDEDSEDNSEIGGVIGESNPPKGFLDSNYFETLEWTKDDELDVSKFLDQIDDWVGNATSREGALLTGSLSAVCNENLVPAIWTVSYEGKQVSRCEFWIPYLRREKTMREFFEDWLYYTPIPGITKPTDGGLQEYDGFSREKYIRDINGPGYYIEYYDLIANTIPGRELNFNTQTFQTWMTDFLNWHGKFLQTSESVAPYEERNAAGITPPDIWIDYKAGGQHPYDMDNYIIPDDGFLDYTRIFLRNLKAGLRPVGQPKNKLAISAPCDAGASMLSYGHVVGTKEPWSDAAVGLKRGNEAATENQAIDETYGSVYNIPGKLGDTFGIVEAFPGYGHSFIGGPVIDFLLWFTDYHHFHSPVSGTVLYSNDFMGSHQYDFDNFDPNFPFGPKPAPGSNQVEWYTNMDKHRRWSIVIDAGPEIGIVGMAPVGFWGVGSMRVYIEVGDVLERGDYIGHFLYGGSSIMLCFEPGKKFNWVDEDGRMINNIQFPNQVDVRAKIGELMVVKD